MMIEVPSPFWHRLLLVEGDALTAAPLVKVLESEGFEVASVESVLEARLCVADFDPECALIDVSLGAGASGADLAHMLFRDRSEIALLLLSRHSDLRTAGLPVLALLVRPGVGGLAWPHETLTAEGCPSLSGVGTGALPSVSAMATAPEPFDRRVLVVEDEPMTAALLERVLVGEGFQVECVADVAQARVAVRDFDPDCALIDISLGVGPSGADLAHVLHHERPDVALLFLTRHPDLRTAGLTDDQVPPNCGFVRKDRVSNPAYLISAIEQVLRDHARDVRDDTDPARPLGELTEHQMEILRLIALGYTNETIATIKGAGRSTVERWVAGILQTMAIDPRGELNPRVEAVRRYVAVAGVPNRP